MSQHSDENFMASSDSFWEPGNYKRTTKRIEDGNKLCSEFMTLVSERADIEKKYARDLKQWAIKWNNIIEKGKQKPGFCAFNGRPMDFNDLKAARSGSFHSKLRMFIAYISTVECVKTGLL